MYYANLHQRLSQHDPVPLSDLLPPSAERLLGHVRLAPSVGSGQAFQDALAAAAQTLIREEGLPAAIERLIGLPVPLPAVLVSAVLDLSPKERHALIKQFRSAASPVGKIHLVYLLLSFDDEIAIPNIAS